MTTTPAGTCGGGARPEISCQACVDFILDYLEGVLPPDQKAKFERHLNMCPNCVTYMDNYKTTAQLARAVGAPPEAPAPVPAALVDAILKARKHAHE
ncbi:MAG: zf-HC2 domain-containing protein [Phycisphaerales bacterium]|jgi:anti-sigma factor RsiW